MTCRNWESGVIVPIHVNSPAGSVYGNTDRTKYVTEARQADAADPASLVEASNPRTGQATRLDHARQSNILSLNETFSSTVPVPVKDGERLIDKGLEPWFFHG